MRLGKPGPHDTEILEAAPLQVYPEAQYSHEEEDRADPCKDAAIFQDERSG
jgi:hypothetical protein